MLSNILNERVVEPTYVRRSYRFVDIKTKQPAYLAELNLFDKDDASALNAIRCIWNTNKSDLALMHDVFEYENGSTSDVKSRYFVLTKQTEDFEKIRPSAVLGIVKTTTLDKELTEIDHIQVNPFYIFSNPYSDLAHVGKALIESVQKLFTESELIACVPKNLIPYMQKLGWKATGDKANAEDVIMHLNKVAKKVL